MSMAESLTIDALNDLLDHIRRTCGEPMRMEDVRIPIYISPYGLPEATYVPGVGIVCKDQAAVDRYKERVRLAAEACEK